MITNDTYLWIALGSVLIALFVCVVLWLGASPNKQEMTVRRFWWSQKQYETYNQLPTFRPRSTPNEVLVNGKWRRYTSIASDKPTFDDVEFVAELSYPIRIRVEKREMAL